MKIKCKICGADASLKPETKTRIFGCNESCVVPWEENYCQACTSEELAQGLLSTLAELMRKRYPADFARLDFRRTKLAFRWLM